MGWIPFSIHCVHLHSRRLPPALSPLRFSFQALLLSVPKLIFSSQDKQKFSVRLQDSVLSLYPIPLLCALRRQHPTPADVVHLLSLPYTKHKAPDHRIPSLPPLNQTSRLTCVFDTRPIQLAPRSHQRQGYLVFQQSSLRPLFCNINNTHHNGRIYPRPDLRNYL